MKTRFLKIGLYAGFCGFLLFPYSGSAAEQVKFDTGGVKMVAPMTGSAVCVPSAKVPCNKNDVPDLTGVVDGAKKRSNSDYEGKISPQTINVGSPYKGVASKVSGRIEAKPYQGKVEEYKEQLKSGIFKSGGKATGVYGFEKIDNLYPDLARDHDKSGSVSIKKKVVTGGESVLRDDERIYILISSSVPLDTLRTYARDIGVMNNKNVRMVMRGFVGGGGMKNALPTMNFIGEILNKDRAACLAGDECDSYPAIVDIDPNIFRRFKPEVVPAIVYVKGVKPSMPDMSEGSDDIVGAFDDRKSMMLYGDASLGYALELFADKSGDDRLKAVGEKLRIY